MIVIIIIIIISIRPSRRKVMIKLSPFLCAVIVRQLLGLGCDEGTYSVCRRNPYVGKKP
jgi:hypothetical protein